MLCHCIEDLTWWLLCTRLCREVVWAAGLWEVPAAGVSYEDNPMLFKVQSKLSGFPLLPSRLVSSLCFHWDHKILHFLTNDGNRAHTENPCGPPNLMRAKSWTPDKRCNIAQGLGLNLLPTLYMRGSVRRRGERSSLATVGRQCFKSPHKLSSSPELRKYFCKNQIPRQSDCFSVLDKKTAADWGMISSSASTEHYPEDLLPPEAEETVLRLSKSKWTDLCAWPVSVFWS